MVVGFKLDSRVCVKDHADVICFIRPAKLVTRFQNFAWPVPPDLMAVGQCGPSAKNAARSRSSTATKQASVKRSFRQAFDVR